MKKNLLSPRERDLIAYAVHPGADLSRDAIATAIGVTPTSVGRVITRLKKRGLIDITRRRHNVITEIHPRFDFEGKAYRVMSPQKRRFWI